VCLFATANFFRTKRFPVRGHREWQRTAGHTARVRCAYSLDGVNASSCADGRIILVDELYLPRGKFARRWFAPALAL